MYSIVQFLESDGGTVSVVNSEWLTPRKCEVYWPPAKGSKAFERVLGSVLSPDEKWKLYGVQRIFCETDCIEKAKQKLKLVEATSDLQTEEEDVLKPKKRKAIKRRRFISSDEENDNDNKGPPPLKRQFVNFMLQNNNNNLVSSPKLSSRERECLKTPNNLTTNYISSGDEENYSHRHPPLNKQLENVNLHIEERPSMSTPKCDRENYSKFTQDSFPTLSSSILQNLEQDILSSNAETQRQIHLDRSNLKLTGFQEKVLSLLSLVKIQNNQMLSLLKQKSGGVILKSVYKFPLQSNEALETTEELLNLPDNYNNLVSYLESLGGRDTSNKASRIMRTIFADSLAKDFNFYGKRSQKKPFCQLRLRNCVVEAVKNATGATEKDIEDNIKVWLKHAPERMLKKRK